MKDIQLWHLLDPQQPPTQVQQDELKVMLAELSQLSIQARLPFLSRLQQLAKTADAETRVQIMRTFRGATGWKAWKFLLQFTNDDSAEVRTAATDALIQSASTSRWVLAHLVFHPTPEIRQYAANHFCELERPLPEIFLYLLVDEHCQAIITDGLTRWGTTINVSPHLLLSLFDNDLLSLPLIRGLIARLSDSALEQCLNQLPLYSTTQCNQILAENANWAELSKTGRDGLQWLLELFWEQSEPAEGTDEEDREEQVARAIDFFENLFRMLRDYRKTNFDLTDRFIASALITASRTGVWNPRVAGCCATLSPDFLLRQDIPLPIRRSAAGVLYELRERVPEHDPKQVYKLLKSSFCRQEDGRLDLWTLGAVLHYRHRDGLKILIDEFTVEQIVTAFLAKPSEFAAFFSYPGSAKIRQEILDVIRKKSSNAAALDALMVFVVPTDGLEFLNELSGDQALRTLNELWKLSIRSEFRLTERKVSITTSTLLNKLSTDNVLKYLQSWLQQPSPASFAIGIEGLGLLLREHLTAEQFIEFAIELDQLKLQNLLESVIRCPGFPYGVEIQLAMALVNHGDTKIRDWAIARAPSDKAPTPQQYETLQQLIIEENDLVAFVEIAPVLADKLESCSESELTKKIKPCLKVPTRGVCPALASRSDPLQPQLEVCAAILGSADPLHEIDAQFQRFGSSQPKFLEALDALMVKSWQSKNQLPLATCVWLCRWEYQLTAFANLAVGRFATLLLQTRKFSSSLLAGQFWFATKRIVNIWRFRQPSDLQDYVDVQLLGVIVDELVERNAELAAEILIAAYQSGKVDDALAKIRNTILAILPELTPQVREILHPWIDSSGLGESTVARRASQTSLTELDLQEVAETDDINRLMDWCRSTNGTWVIAAARRCISLGGNWLESLAILLTDDLAPVHPAIIADTVSEWPAEYWDFATQLAEHDNLDLNTRFLICLNLAEVGKTEWLEQALELACHEAETSWFQREYLSRLRDLVTNDQWLAVRLATSPHPYAYQFAISQIVEAKHPTNTPPPQTPGTQELREALHCFLDCGSERVRSLRLDAADWLLRHDDYYGYPLLLKAVADAPAQHERELPIGIFPEKLVGESVETALLGGPSVFPEERILTLLELNRHSSDAYQSAAINFNEAATSNLVRQRLARQMRKGLSHSKKLRSVAETFAWGIPIARELTERLFTIQMIGGDDYGYTRLHENKIYINPLPILQRKSGGRDIVEGLILHELGHHMYHRGDQEARIWEQAQNEGIGRLLNLVSDEHLERNLRALDPSFGDRLKKLGAYAFRHSTKEVNINDLLQALNLRAFEVLVDGRMRVARRPGCIRLSTRRVLQQLERSGSSFSRFFQALRLGLGNRHNDPRVAEALELFQKGFRNSSMERLYEITVRIREIFGDECEILNCFGQNRICEGEGSQIMIDGEGMTNEDVQSEIHRISNPESGVEGGHQNTSRWINVSDKLDFHPITTITRVHATHSEHAEYVKPIMRHANQLRRYLAELGLVMTPQRRRIRGRGLDRAGLSTALLKNDPRILQLREPRYETDLFIGVVIDCSGSMEYDDNIEKAKMFGALLAESVRGMSTVDLRVFGFTDSVIYDAGTAERPGLANLKACGGNNDAAALLHTAQQAQASRRRAKLLVMISDGLPTECSVTALRSLVNVLTRKWKMCCAQVAVQPLEEICFPNYVLLDTSEPGLAVRQFGLTIARLIRKSMAQSN